MSNTPPDFTIVEDATNTKNSNVTNNNIRSFLGAGFRKLINPNRELKQPACISQLNLF